MRNKVGMRTRPSQGLIHIRNGESLLSLAHPRGMVRGASLQNPRSSNPRDHSTPQRTARPQEDNAVQLGDRAPSQAGLLILYACLLIPPLRQSDASQSIARAFPPIPSSTASTRMERPRATRRDSVRAERPLLPVPVPAPHPPLNTNAQPAFPRRAILPFRTLTREPAWSRSIDRSAESSSLPPSLPFSPAACHRPSYLCRPVRERSPNLSHHWVRGERTG